MWGGGGLAHTPSPAHRQLCAPQCSLLLDRYSPCPPGDAPPLVEQVVQTGLKVFCRTKGTLAPRLMQVCVSVLYVCYMWRCASR